MARSRLTKRSRRTSRRQRTQPTKRKIEQLIEEAIVDAYDESEQRVGFLTLLEEHLALPFTTTLLGVGVTVERIDLGKTSDIVARCRHGKARQAIPILELPLPTPPPAGAEWIEAYRSWVRGR